MADAGRQVSQGGRGDRQGHAGPPIGHGRLRILLLGPASSVHMARWARDLAAAGHQVIVASWRPGAGIPAARLRIAPAAGAWPARRALLAIGWLRRLVRQFRPDLIHVHSLGSYGLLAIALPGRSCPVVSTPWGSELRSARRSAARSAVVRLALRRADLVLPTSAEVAAELTARYRVPPDRIRTLSWGVPESLFARLASTSPAAVRKQLGVASSAIIVLSVRGVSDTYRTREIVSAFAAAAAGRPDLFLIVLAGHRGDRRSATPARDRYASQIRATITGLAGQALLVDRLISQEETFDLICASDVAVSVPRGDQRSSSVLEAALAGCHLLLSDIPPYRELVDDGLAADLLGEPVTASLADALRLAGRDPVAQRVNREYVSRCERGSAKVTELERLYLMLAAARNP